MAKINNLQVLRAFAALNVALFHILGTSTAYGFGLNYMKPLLGWGSNGVDIFLFFLGLSWSTFSAANSLAQAGSFSRGF